jgi:hypothetical protein
VFHPCADLVPQTKQIKRAEVTTIATKKIPITAVAEKASALSNDLLRRKLPTGYIAVRGYCNDFTKLKLL